MMVMVWMRVVPHCRDRMRQAKGGRLCTRTPSLQPRLRPSIAITLTLTLTLAARIHLEGGSEGDT